MGRSNSDAGMQPPDGPAGLHGLDPGRARGPAADVVDDLADRDAHRHFDQAGVPDLADQAEDLGARSCRAFRSWRTAAAPFATMMGMLAQVSTLLIAVGLPSMPFSHGVGRPLARLAPFSLDRTDQRRLFAADERAGALHQLDIEGEARAQDVGRRAGRVRAPAAAR